MWRTPANLLSALRLPVAVLIAVAIMHASWASAALLFTAAVATDVADGRLARQRGEVSALGGLLDHGGDAVFVATLLAALAARGAVPVILPWLVIVAFGQYVLDSRVLAGRALRMSVIGRSNGIAYYALGGLAIASVLLVPLAQAAPWIRLGGWLLVGSTLVSMADRGLALLPGRRLEP